MTTIRLIAVIFFAVMFSACSKSANDADSAGAAEGEQASAQPAEIDLASIESVEIVPGLTSKTVRDGSGVVAEVGHTAVVHYTGWL